MKQEFKINSYNSHKLLNEILIDSNKKYPTLHRHVKFQSNLYKYDIKKIINSLDALSKKLIKNEATVSIIKKYDIGFLIPFLKKNNLESIIELNFDNKLKLNKPISVSKSKRIFLQPKGVLVHWISGNMPVLGFISLVCGLLTKNINIIKLPTDNTKEFLDLFNEILTNKFFSKEKYLFKNVIPVNIKRSEITKLNKLSLAADTRIFWGGKDGLININRLEKKLDCNDLIMGPKLSSVLISTNYFDSLNTKNKKQLLQNVVKDVMTGNQKGCNSPHFLYLLGNKVSSEKIIMELEDTFREILKRDLSTSFNPFDKYNSIDEVFNFVVSKKGNIKGKIYESFKIFFFKDRKSIEAFKSPLYGNTLFVQNIKKISDCYIQANPQTISIATSNENNESITNSLINLGFLRIVKPGAMSAYDHPWDGMLPLNHLVKYISISK